MEVHAPPPTLRNVFSIRSSLPCFFASQYLDSPHDTDLIWLFGNPIVCKFLKWISEFTINTSAYHSEVIAMNSQMQQRKHQKGTHVGHTFCATEPNNWTSASTMEALVVGCRVFLELDLLKCWLFGWIVGPVSQSNKSQ